MDSKYLFIITLLFFIQPNWAELEFENALEHTGDVGCCEKCGREIKKGVSNFENKDEFYSKQYDIKELQVKYSIFVLLIVLKYLQ